MPRRRQTSLSPRESEGSVANAVWQHYKESILNGDSNSSLSVNTSTDGPFCALVDLGTYTFNAAHQFYSSISGVVGTDQRITTPTVTNGVFDGDDLTYTSVTGNSVEALVVYRHNSGANTTWRLVLFEDTSVTGLPVTPNGGNIVVTWNASGIFQISDKRLKEDIVQIGEHGPLGVYEFTYKGSQVRSRGLLAQEVAKVLPDCVLPFKTRHGPRLAVCYNRVVERLAA